MIVELYSPFYFVDRFQGTLVNFGLLSQDEGLENIEKMSDFSETMVKSPQILFVGLNPSLESPDNSAFHPLTKSGKTVRDWMKDSNAFISFTNLSNSKDAPIKSELKVNYLIKHAVMQKYKIIACGSVVQDVLEKYNIQHFAMPHPSGLNRFWNDKEAGEAKIKEMREYLNGK